MFAEAAQEHGRLLRGARPAATDRRIRFLQKHWSPADCLARLGCRRAWAPAAVRAGYFAALWPGAHRGGRSADPPADSPGPRKPATAAAPAAAVFDIAFV